MRRYNMERITQSLVKLWGHDVGLLSWSERRGLASFQYTDSFCDTGIEISPLMMPLLRGKVYEFPENRASEVSSTFCGLPGIFSDSLPEKYGNTLMRKWLDKQGIDFKDLNPIERLCYVGKRGMGALEYEPAIDFYEDTKDTVFVDELVDIAKRVLVEQNEKHILTDKDNEIMEQLIRIGTSAGGAKAKAIVALQIKDNKIVSIYSGQGEPRKELSYWILKFSDVKNDEHKSDIYSGRIEYAYYLMAKNSGINMSPCHIINDKNGIGHFITQRFDRVNGQKIHMTTFCGLAHEDRNPVGMTSYEKLFATARALKLDNTSLCELYRRMVFNIIARNQDDHSKNHSFLLHQGSKWEISPAYDLSFSYNKDSRWIALQQMSCNGKRDNFTYRDLIECAKAADIHDANKIIHKVRDGIDTWADCARRAKIPNGISDEIQKHFRMDIREKKCIHAENIGR